VRLALIGYGSVGKAFARLLEKKRTVFPFRITGIHTLRHGTAYDPKGLPIIPTFGPAAASVADFLQQARPDVAVEITTLAPESGEPAISYIREAFALGIHVITANKGPIAYAYAELRDEAKRNQVEFRFESTVMDGAPVFNKVRNNLPGVTILGFTGVLNSTSKVVVDAMQRGLSMQDGIRLAQSAGIAEADASYDIDGWDSAAKTAALANVLMNAGLTPQAVRRSGLRDLTTEAAVKLAEERKTVMLVSRGRRLDDGSVDLEVKPEILNDNDMLATAKGSSNLLLLHTDLMGTVGTVLIEPGVEQTAYGLFLDLVDIARSL
jgi:homoserine dehydrogenase